MSAKVGGDESVRPAPSEAPAIEGLIAAMAVPDAPSFRKVRRSKSLSLPERIDTPQADSRQTIKNNVIIASYRKSIPLKCRYFVDQFCCFRWYSVIQVQDEAKWA